MFTRIHDALDIPTPPGAFERLRTELTRKPVQPRRWPALQMRTSTMGFRLAAGLVVVAIAAAAGAAAVAIHNSTNNVSPAGSGMSIQAYQKMMADDRPNPNAVWASCDDVTHSGCMSSAQRSIPLLQKWLDEITKAQPPARFVLINGEMRQHLVQNIAVLNDLVRDSNAHDNAAMSRDYDVALYGVDWTGLMVPAIAQSQVVSSATYMQLVGTEAHTLDVCGAPCGFGSATATCSPASGLTCSAIFDQIAVSFGDFQAAIVQAAAPASLASLDANLQNDLAHADTVLLAMNLDVSANNQRFKSEMGQLIQIKSQVDADAAKITG